ncbi:MAG: SDR family oxidoreductase [Plesiomonas sp.]|uniref:SDR family oxidoreductase n=1 Tax=Plesiomonas sp. TaxID=2486279 RepID=UPI003F30621F
MDNKKISIIGLGWLGMPLAMHLQSAGYAVVGSKTTADGVAAAQLSGIESYLLNLNPQIECDDTDLDTLLNVDTMVVNIPPGRKNYRAQFYLEAIQNWVDSALANQVKHLIFISSTSVYGKASGEVDESSGCYPETGSARELYELELWLHGLPNIRIDVLRCAGLVGPDRHPGRFLAGKQNLPEGAQGVNLVHLDDCITAILRLIECRLPEGQTYNLCAPEHPVRSAFYPQIAKNLGLDAPTFLPDLAGRSRIINGNKICCEQGFTYHYPDPFTMLF